MEKQIIIEDFDKLIKVIIFSKFSTKLKEFEDYYQDGFISYCKALRNYDSTKNTGLATYASRVIINDLLQKVNKENKYRDKFVYNQKAFEYATSTKENSYEYDFTYNTDMEDKLRLFEKLLTKQEYQILDYLVKGYSFKEIDLLMDITTNQRCVIVNHLRNKLINFNKN